MGLMLTGVTGKLVDPLDVKVTDIDIRDIAHALSRICRYGGHVRSFYSVAEHSVRVSELAAGGWGKGGDRNGLARCGLLHDATEAYLGDIVRGLKKSDAFAAYRTAEAALAERIADRFGLPRICPKEVEEADRAICGPEMRQLLAFAADELGAELPRGPDHLVLGVWGPDEAETQFLARFHELWRDE